jgi:hypothetical protein
MMTDKENRAARRQAARNATAAAEPCPVRVSEAPKTNAERYALERECLKAAKAAGHRGVQRKVAAARYYNAAVSEAGNAVREPGTQGSVLARPGAAVPTPPAPRGMEQTASGLYVPQETT